MEVHFETASPQARALRDIAINRVGFVLRRLSWLVARVRVRCTDVNGPRGGIDKHCRVEMTMPGNRTVVATSTAPDWRRAFETALGKAARALVRIRQRARRPARTGRNGSDALPVPETAAENANPEGGRHVLR